MTTLYAQPYNLDDVGFYFESFEEFETRSQILTDRFGQAVEEFEIQLIDGDDSELFDACGINQSNLATWFDEIEPLEVRPRKRDCIACVAVFIIGWISHWRNWMTSA